MKKHKKNIPLFIEVFKLSNKKVFELLKEKGVTISEGGVHQKLNKKHPANFNKFELLKLEQIEKEFLNDIRTKLVKLKKLKYE